MTTVPKTRYKLRPRVIPKGEGYTPYAISHNPNTRDFVAVPDDPTLDITDAVTLEAWVNPPSYQYSAFICKEGIYKIDYYNGKVRFLTGEDWSGTILLSDENVPLNRYTQVVAVYDGSEKRIYLNAHQMPTTVSTSGSMGSNDNYVGVGESIDNTGTPFDLADPANWDVAITRIYNRDLTDAEIEHNRRFYHRPVTSGLVLHLKMNEGTGTTVKDHSGNGNDGTMNNYTRPYGWVNVGKWELRAGAGL